MFFYFLSKVVSTGCLFYGLFFNVKHIHYSCKHGIFNNEIIRDYECYEF